MIKDSNVEGVCVTKSVLSAEADRVAEGLCSEARADLISYREGMSAERKRADQCEARLLDRPISTPPKRRSPWFLRAGLLFGTGGFAIASGLVLNSNSPGEVKVLFPTLTATTLISALVLQALDDRK